MYFWVERVMVSSLTIYRHPPPALCWEIRDSTLKKGIFDSWGGKNLDSPKNKATKPTATVTPASLN